jgi:hypothetical protein
LDEVTIERISFQLEALRCCFKQFAFLHRESLYSAASAGVKERLAKELSVSGVNEGMRRQNSRQFRKWPPGGKQKTATLKFITLMLEDSIAPGCGLAGKTPCLGAHTQDELLSVGWRFLLCSVIGLTKFVSKSLDQVWAFTQKDIWRAVFKSYRDKGGPARMSA